MAFKWNSFIFHVNSSCIDFIPLLGWLCFVLKVLAFLCHSTHFIVNVLSMQMLSVLHLLELRWMPLSLDPNPSCFLQGDSLLADKASTSFYSRAIGNLTHGRSNKVCNMKMTCPLHTHTHKARLLRAQVNVEDLTWPCWLLTLASPNPTSGVKWNTDGNLYRPASVSALVNSVNPCSGLQSLMDNLKAEESRLLELEINTHCSHTLHGFNTTGSKYLWPHCLLLPKPIRTQFMNACVLANETSAVGMRIFQ